MSILKANSQFARGRKVGREGTDVVKAKRAVRPGGVIIYQGNTYQHDRLIPFVGKQVLIWEFDGYIEIWSFHIEVRRKCRAGMQGLEWYNIDRTVIDEWICTINTPYPTGPVDLAPEDADAPEPGDRDHAEESTSL